ncbi:MAG: helix-hairpin-helix domain-containing protein [Chloroflexota bacterium]
MEHPFPWRVLEDSAEASETQAGPPVESRGVSAAPPDSAAPTGGGPRRGLGLVAGVAAAVVAVVAASAVVIGSTFSPALVLPGDGAAAQGVIRLLADGTAAVANPGDQATAGATDGPVLVVDVAGAVRIPGVYRLAPGARVADAVAAAGGFGPRVDVEAASRINLAAALHDGEQVRVPSRDDPPPAPSPAPVSRPGVADASAGGLVNLNTATAAALDALPGVGPVTAAKIIAAREEAPFTTVDDLRSRGVLGEATFGKLRDLVTVGP